MAYSDFSLNAVEMTFGITTRLMKLFPGVRPVPVPTWLSEALERGLKMPISTEKARGELIVMPVLLAARELTEGPLAIYSGARMDVDSARGLTGECDFLLARSDSVPEVRPPVVAIVEAKRGNIEDGVGQCAAQMIGAKLFGERFGRPSDTIYGCVTSGEVWLFLRLQADQITVDTDRYYLDNLPGILGVFQTILAPPPEPVSGPHP
jgi:hypothetical protein